MTNLSSGTSTQNTPASTAKDLRSEIKFIDELATEGLSKIGAIARLALLALKDESPRRNEDLEHALNAIWHQADDTMNCVGWHAEQAGHDYVESSNDA